MKQKNKTFSIVIVLSVIFLAILWSRERVYHRRLSHVKEVVADLEFSVHLLKLRARALKEEVEMMNMSTYLRLIENMERGTGKLASYKSDGSRKR